MDSFYPIKHWVLTLLVGPLLMTGYEMAFYNSGNSGGFPEYFALYFIFGLFFSLPVLLIYYIVYIMLIKKTNSVIRVKMILNALTIIGIIITFQKIVHLRVYGLTIVYSAATVVTSLFIKMRRTHSINKETNISSLS